MCICRETYIGETRRNAQIKWHDHEDPKKESEPAKHFRNHPDQSFSCQMLLSVPAKNHIRKTMKASLITLNRPTLNEQVESHRLLLFRNGIT